MTNLKIAVRDECAVSAYSDPLLPVYKSSQPWLVRVGGSQPWMGLLLASEIKQSFLSNNLIFYWLLSSKQPDPTLLSIIVLEYGERSSVQFSSVTQSCLTLCNPMDCSTAGLPVHHQLPEFTQTHVHWIGDAIQPSHPLSSPSPPAFNHSQHQGLFKWVRSSHQVAKVLEFQLQHQSFQWIFRTDLL